MVWCVSIWGNELGGEGNGEFYLGQAEGRLILLLLRVSDNIPMVFTLVLLCCRQFASGEGKQCVFFVGILTKRFHELDCPLKTSV